MHPSQVILGPILSEQAATLSTAGVYAIKVARTASKTDIASALKNVFGVDAIAINTSITHRKTVRRARSKKAGPVDVRIGGFKKAFIRLKVGQELPTPVLAANAETTTEAKA